MTDALDAQLAPLDRELRAIAPRADRLQGADQQHYGIGGDERGHDPRRAR